MSSFPSELSREHLQDEKSEEMTPEQKKQRLQDFKERVRSVRAESIRKEFHEKLKKFWLNEIACSAGIKNEILIDATCAVNRIDCAIEASKKMQKTLVSWKN